ncbi:mobilization protein MbpA [Joostella sp. CR20]|uniref:mobilization protein MbpA n=1 Tax=Joostella sp. CR20 TaxID=2804312 RepID=UPI00313BB83E
MKKEFIQFRCSLYEKKILKIKAKSAGLTLSEFLLKSATNAKIIERLTDEQITMYQTLTKFHNNFIAISNLFNKKDPKLASEVKLLANQIKSHLSNFKK